MKGSDYQVSIARVWPRHIAAVRARMRAEQVGAQFVGYLNQVYDASRSGAVQLDGQNVFVYHPAGDGSGEFEIDFGVGATAPFEPVGAVRYLQTPGGMAATTTHWGEYRDVRRAHDAVVQWCRAQGRALAGPLWEVYGHYDPNASRQRTDVYHLLRD